jgi:hypothetical protein
MPNNIAQYPDFEVVYPGRYTKLEKEVFKKFIAECKAIDERGPVDVKALISGKLPPDTPGIGNRTVATEAMIRYNNNKFDPENPLRNDAAYARKAGYQDILAYPAFACNDDSYLHDGYPGDTHEVCDLNYVISSYKPIYPGDILYLVINKWTFRDITSPKGSIYRSVATRHEGSVYNQKGEKVNDVIFRVTELQKYFKEGRKPKDYSEMHAPPWMKSRPPHYYTDKDWEYIKAIWANEKRQGATPLYWEDVNIGDEPTWTLEGPIEQSISPIPPWGMGIYGSRASLKKEIMDPKILPTLVRSEKDGIYRLPNRNDQIPPVPEYKEKLTAAPGAIALGMIGRREDATGVAAQELNMFAREPEGEDKRTILINYTGRDLAVRHFTNWMGDQGWLQQIRWSVFEPRTLAPVGKGYYPINPESERFLEKVPKWRGKFVNTHGLTTDIAIIKSCVYDKYVRNDEYFVELGWMIENIEGYIWTEGGATVRLPSKNAK